jgi:hypothetical protein
MIQHNLTCEQDMRYRRHTHGFTWKIVIVTQNKIKLIILTWITKICLANYISSKSADGGKEAM